MNKLTVTKSQYTAYQGKEFDNLMNYLDYQAGTQAVCSHKYPVIHSTASNSRNVYHIQYCGHCGLVLATDIQPVLIITG